MSKLASLKSASSLRELAVVLGYKPKTISYILYIKSKADLYSEFSIPKKSGGFRKISKPCEELRGLQRTVSDFLHECVEEINKERKIISAISHAYRKKHSVATNALQHKKRRYVFNVDHQNFFGDINFGRVRGFFISNRHFGLHPKVATVLAQIACFQGVLPQGSPCSPIISNLIGHLLDIKLVELASSWGCTYTRYADDLTFSTNKKSFPEAIACLDGESAHSWAAGSTLTKIIQRSGFSVNSKKTRMQYRDSRQSVTGLVVNSKVNTSYTYRRYARAMADQLFYSGKYVFPGTGEEGTVEQLCGVFSYIHMIAECHRAVDERWEERKIVKRHRYSSIETVYKELLFYRRFYANSKPLIIYEGKTDAVYIRAAIKSLANKGDFPELARKNEKGEVELKVDLFRYTKTAARILNLPGGVEPLRTLISEYVSLFSRYKAPGNKNPVIMVIDNDGGSKNIYSLIKQLKKLPNPVDGTEDHYFTSKNLFVVPTPKLNGKQSMIEDFFDKKTLGYRIGGKIFDTSNEYDTASAYGKNTFAEVVVQKNQDSIDFSGFRTLLKRIEDVVKFYKPS